MKKYTKRFRGRAPLAVLLTLCLLLTVFSGCHGHRDVDAFQVPEEFDTSRDYEITFWAKNDTNVTQVEIYKKAIADFEALYPNITVKMKLYTDYGRLYNDVITNISTGTTPNVCITYPDHIATYMEGENVVVSLDALFADEKYGFGGSQLRYDGPEQSEIIEKFLDECQIGSSYYAIPYMRSTEACYINKDYVEKLGYEVPEVLTWDFVWEVSQAALAKDADGNYELNGQKVMIPFIYKSTDNMMIQMLRQQGADYSTDDGQIGIFNDTTKEVLYTVAEYVESGAFCTFKIVSYPADYLNAGQCIFAIDSTAGATWMGSDAPLMDIAEDQVVDFETAVRPIPQYDTENPQMISQGPSVCVFNQEDPQQVLASWLFAQFLLTNEVQIAYAQTEGYVPVTAKAQNSAEYQDYLSRRGEDNDLYYDVKIDATQLLLDHVDDTFVTAVFNGSTSLRNAAGQMIENVAKSIRRKQTVDEAYMQQLFAEMTALYRLDQIQTGQNTGGAQDLGALPATAVLLLGAVGACWVAMGTGFVIARVRQRKREKSGK